MSLKATSSETVVHVDVNPDCNQGIEDVHMLNEALEKWTEGLPPFIEDSIPSSVNPGNQMRIWRSSDIGGLPRAKEPNDVVTVGQWKDTNSKYIIWKLVGGIRVIVKANGHVNDCGWVSMHVWHGPEKEWSPKRQLWTKNEAEGNPMNLATFNPKVFLKGADGTVLGKTDRNHKF